MNEALAVFVLLLFVGTLLLLLPFATHRGWLLLASRHGSRSAPGDLRPDSALPPVTVQLPVFNERHVVGRLIDAACSLDYPRDRLQVQVLDDSTDDTTERARERVRLWRSRGVDVELLHRRDREGFKAGALARGTREARGDFLLVLDADFVAPPGLVRALVPPFRDPRVGMVQARWDHLNREENWLTRAQCLLLDGHFFFEHGGRFARDLFFNFNGTAGMWRRTCLEDAGGWQSDTLTEDLDLSYRAQMAGWRFVFLEDVGVPAEVPARVGSLEIQQRRWAQGGIQTARKILPDLLRGPWSGRVKVEAVIHLLGHLAHPLTALLGLLILPAAVARRSLELDHLLWLDLPLFLAATGPFVAFYAAAAKRRGRSWTETLRDVPRTLALGIGLSAPVSRAVVRGLDARGDGFVRTPKRGGAERPTYVGTSSRGDTLSKVGLGGLMTVCVILAVAGGYWAQLPFLVLFASGHLGLGLPALGERLRAAGGTGDEPEGDQEEDGEPEDQPSPHRLRPDPGLLVRI